MITVKNLDTMCMACAIVTAQANSHKENWTSSQIKMALMHLENYKRSKQVYYMHMLMFLFSIMGIRLRI